MSTCNKCLGDYQRVDVKKFAISLPLPGWMDPKTQMVALRRTKINLCKTCISKLNREDKK